MFPTRIKIILIILFLLCLLEMPYGYFQIVRFIGFLGFVILAYQAYEKSKKEMFFIFASLALLFQPFFKIALGRTIWNIVDVLVAVFLLGSIFVTAKKSR